MGGRKNEVFCGGGRGITNEGFVPIEKKIKKNREDSPTISHSLDQNGSCISFLFFSFPL